MSVLDSDRGFNLKCECLLANNWNQRRKKL